MLHKNLNQEVTKYDAFISYSHHDDYSYPAAEKIVKKMEGIKIPIWLRKHHKDGIKIFVDKKETSMASSVINAFEEYLQHSKYMICICSKEYSNSKFSMEHEIPYAQKHNKPIIAVLMEGEKTIPKLLCDQRNQPLPSVTVIDFSKGDEASNILRICSIVLNVPFGILKLYETIRLHKKITGIILTALFTILFFTYFVHIHHFRPATCTSPKTCTGKVRIGLFHFEECHETAGTALGHSFVYTEISPCIKQIRCERCGLTQTITNHQMIPIDDYGGFQCSVCGYLQKGEE